MNNKYDLITVLGPTASGKTKFAVEIARRLNGEIISADSRQVYRGMDIGTGKDIDEYSEGGEPVSYHLIDICEAGEKYNLYRWLEDYHKAYDDIRQRGKLPILCGGTGLYVEAALKDYQLHDVPQNPELRQELEGRSLGDLTEILKALKAKRGSVMHNSTDVDTAQRAIRAIEIEQYELEHGDTLQEKSNVEKQVLVLGIDVSRDVRRERISSRLKARIDGGMVDEIRGLINKGVSAEDLIYYGLEYKFVTQYVIGQLSYEKMYRQLEIAIHQFAKRQMTWFRGMERRGIHINWVENDANAVIEKFRL